MTENEFLSLAEQSLTKIEQKAEQWEVDVDPMRSGNVLVLETGKGKQVVLNIQAAMQEIWLASCLGGFHYRYRDGEWFSTQGNSVLEKDVYLAVIAADAQ